MMELRGYQRSALIRMAHDLDPAVYVGKAGLAEGVFRALDDALERNELVKVRFVAWKDEREDLARELAERLGALLVAVIGHVAVFYREASDPERRRVIIPYREEG
ncbi:protein of unknown function UPF0044 [Spirochaeta thermophila DSM 6578]|uniref:CRM domain-containing protein n=1 Tax=Winmispira thermophila (strain ATCC 700085 / DSM 6578 / Z-1203) TaxID=869211 RepID=G0GCL6_WINT7|nr:YhbY family RNA-binding protein [Spirochaeta thermophila]AEJ62082.1 protein of unknown function UPF0044 [Spirochaeta thermophila DSM 6578]